MDLKKRRGSANVEVPMWKTPEVGSRPGWAVAAVEWEWVC